MITILFAEDSDSFPDHVKVITFEYIFKNHQLFVKICYFRTSLFQIKKHSKKQEVHTNIYGDKNSKVPVFAHTSRVPKAH